MAATNSTSFRITGIQQVSKNIQQFEADMQSKMLRPAVRKGMAVVRNDAIQRAVRIDDPRTPNKIADHIHLKTYWQKDRKTMSASVGVAGGARYRRGDKADGKVTYFRYVEFGTERSRALPFLRPALANNTNRVLQEFIFELQRQMTLKG